jgi:hypothetical protein
MQGMLIAQDNLGEALRRLCMLKVDDRILLPFTPPSLQSQVFGGVPDPVPITEMFSDDVLQDDKLLPLIPQKKEQWKTSYGIR